MERSQGAGTDDIPDFVGMLVPEEHGDGRMVSPRGRDAVSLGSDPYPSMAKPRMRERERDRERRRKGSSPRPSLADQSADSSFMATPSSSGRNDSRAELPSFSSLQSSGRRGDASFASTPGGSEYATAHSSGSSALASSPWDYRNVNTKTHTPTRGPPIASFSSPLTSTPQHMKYPPRERISSASGISTTPTAVPWRANDPSEWTMERVLMWLDMCKFGPQWKDTFRERGIFGNEFLKLSSYQNLKKLGHFYGRTDDYDNSPSRFLNALRKVLARSSSETSEIDIEDNKVTEPTEGLHTNFCSCGFFFFFPF